MLELLEVYGIAVSVLEYCDLETLYECKDMISHETFKIVEKKFVDKMPVELQKEYEVLSSERFDYIYRNDTTDKYGIKSFCRFWKNIDFEVCAKLSNDFRGDFLYEKLMNNVSASSGESLYSMVCMLSCTRSHYVVSSIKQKIQNTSWEYIG
jgi:hypothetical protein